MSLILKRQIDLIVHPKEERMSVRQASNQFIVEDSIEDENSCTQIPQERMEELALFKGDAIFIRSDKGKETLVIALTAKDLPNNKICMNKTVRKNLKVRIGDSVEVRNAGEVPMLTRIHVLPIESSLGGYEGDLAESHLIPYFKEAYRPVKKGDLFLVRGGQGPIEFKLVDCQPGEFGIVAPNTVLDKEGQPISYSYQEDFMHDYD